MSPNYINPKPMTTNKIKLYKAVLKGNQDTLILFQFRLNNFNDAMTVVDYLKNTLNKESNLPNREIEITSLKEIKDDKQVGWSGQEED